MTKKGRDKGAKRPNRSKKRKRNDSYLVQDPHHIVARSRWQNEQTNMLPRKWHVLWHQLFGEMTPSEVKQFIDTVMRRGTRWTVQELHALKVEIMNATNHAVDQQEESYWKPEYD